ncbi:hypothetical protein Droror1_Dr00004620 [Drosera rotundifolia]
MVCNRKKGIISTELGMRSEAEYKNKSLKMKGEQEIVPRNNVQQSPKDGVWTILILIIMSKLHQVPLPAPAPSLSSGPSSTRRTVIKTFGISISWLCQEFFIFPRISLEFSDELY